MKMIPILMTILFTAAIGRAEDLGNLSANPFDFDSSSNMFGKGSPFAPNSINNSFGPYGSPFSNKSATNPFATDAPRLYDQQGNYRGKLSANPYDPDSTSNQFGRYGSPFSPDSLNNQFGAGSPFRYDSPNNPYGKGWKIEEGEGCLCFLLTRPLKAIRTGFAGRNPRTCRSLCALLEFSQPRFCQPCSSVSSSFPSQLSRADTSPLRSFSRKAKASLSKKEDERTGGTITSTRQRGKGNERRPIPRAP
jgi:hypothetical protein